MPNIIRRDPFFELTSLQDRVNQLLGQAFGGFEGLPLATQEFLPPVDILEQEQNLILTAEIPGVKPEDLKIVLENNVLTISGERKFEEEEVKENFLRMERRYGRFTRSFTLPVGLDVEHVVAAFENGVLTLTLPKRAEFKPKQINIGVTKAIPPAKAKEKAA